MKIQIVPAVEDDLETILILQKECYQSEAALHDAYNIPPLTQTLDEIIADFNQGTLFLKGVVDRKIIASVRGFVLEGTAHIGRLMVDQAFQNKKYGQLMMQAIEASFMHATRFELFTGDKSLKNILFYQKIGYVEFKRKTLVDGLVLVYLEKRI